MIIGDIHLVVILIGRTQFHQKDIFFKTVCKGNVKTQTTENFCVYGIN